MECNRLRRGAAEQLRVQQLGEVDRDGHGVVLVYEPRAHQLHRDALGRVLAHDVLETNVVELAPGIPVTFAENTVKT